MCCVVVSASSSCSQLLSCISIHIKYIVNSSWLCCVSAVLAIGIQHDYVDRVCYGLRVTREEDEEDGKENCFNKIVTSVMVKF